MNEDDILTLLAFLLNRNKPNDEVAQQHETQFNPYEQPGMGLGAGAVYGAGATYQPVSPEFRGPAHLATSSWGPYPGMYNDGRRAPALRQNRSIMQELLYPSYRRYGQPY